VLGDQVLLYAANNSRAEACPRTHYNIYTRGVGMFPPFVFCLNPFQLSSKDFPSSKICNLLTELQVPFYRFQKTESSANTLPIARSASREARFQVSVHKVRATFAYANFPDGPWLWPHFLLELVPPHFPLQPFYCRKKGSTLAVVVIKARTNSKMKSFEYLLFNHNDE
jgi:hypothetical protein